MSRLITFRRIFASSTPANAGEHEHDSFPGRGKAFALSPALGLGRAARAGTRADEGVTLYGRIRSLRQGGAPNLAALERVASQDVGGVEMSSGIKA